MRSRILRGVPATAVVDPQTGNLRRLWLDWFRELAGHAEAGPFRVQTVSLVAQQATIATTAIPIEGLQAGLYRVSLYLRITRAATSSSSATVILTWVDGGVTQTRTFTALTTNTTASWMTGTMCLRCDADRPSAPSSLTYAVTYASSGATAMRFSLDVCVESVPGVTT